MRKINLLMLTRYSTMGASSRLRSLDYIPYYEQAGISVTNAPLFDDEYIEELYNNKKRSKLKIIKSYVNRFKCLMKTRKYDVIFIEKELFPFLPGPIESIITFLNVPYIIDYDDAIFHNYDMSENLIIRSLLSNKLSRLIKNSYCVTAGNSYLSNYAKKNGARNIEYIPTVVDIKRYNQDEVDYLGELRLGWIGSPSTSNYLRLLWPVFEEINQDFNVKLVTIGAPLFDDCPIPLEQHEWTLETECDVLATVHVGIMPLLPGPWEEGKCGYKLIQYMASSRPVIASAVGANIDIIDSSFGCLASTDEDWVRHIKSFILKPDLINTMGKIARKEAELSYTRDVAAMKLTKIIIKAAER